MVEGVKVFEIPDETREREREKKSFAHWVNWVNWTQCVIVSIS